MRPIALIILCAVTAATAADKPTAYNPINGQTTDVDRLAHEGLGKQYEIVDVDINRRKWIPPKGVSGFGRTEPVYLENKCVPGTALVIYAISIDGRPLGSFAAQATNDLLAGVAVHQMSERQFAPAQMDGRPVASVAATRFNFPCPAPH
jgi:hypothetical protein